MIALREPSLKLSAVQSSASTVWKTIMNLTVGLSLLFCLVASTSAASTYQNDEQDSVIALLEGLNLNDVLVELIEQFKTIMPCGIPSLGVPALVPFELNHTEFKIDKTGLL